LNTNKSAENKGKVLFININVEFVMTGRPEREQVWDYPLEALREALINAVCHRKWEKGYFKSVAIRHVGQSAVNSKYLLRLQIPAPPLPEQRRIAEILSTVDKKLELERRRKGKLERIKRGLMNELQIGIHPFIIFRNNI
jgi:hypothetical protein